MTPRLADLRRAADISAFTSAKSTRPAVETPAGPHPLWDPLVDERRGPVRLPRTDVPSIDRVSDESKTRADEKQDLTTSLNFPLHWTSATESWHYLFDFAVACQLLAPRPDDRVLVRRRDVLGVGAAPAARHPNVSVDLSVEMMQPRPAGSRLTAGWCFATMRHCRRREGSRCPSSPKASTAFCA